MVIVKSFVSRHRKTVWHFKYTVYDVSYLYCTLSYLMACINLRWPEWRHEEPVETWYVLVRKIYLQVQKDKNDKLETSIKGWYHKIFYLFWGTCQGHRKFETTNDKVINSASIMPLLTYTMKWVLSFPIFRFRIWKDKWFFQKLYT